MRYWGFVFQTRDGLFTAEVRIYPLSWTDDDVLWAVQQDAPGRLVEWRKQPMVGD